MADGIYAANAPAGRRFMRWATGQGPQPEEFEDLSRYAPAAGSLGSMASAKALLSRYRPRWANSERGPSIREWLGGKPGITESPQSAAERLEAGITIPYQHGGTELGDILQPGAGSFSARPSPTREFTPGLPVGSKQDTLHNLYQQLLEANIFGQTYN